MHDRAGKRAIGTGTKAKMHIRRDCRCIAIGVDDDNLRVPLLAGAGDMGHHIDLGMNRIGAPDDDKVRFRHFPGVRPIQGAGADIPAGPCQHCADCRFLPGVFLHMPKTVDTVPLHQSHGSGVIIGPDGFRSIFCLPFKEFLGDFIKGSIPGNLLPLPRSFRPDTPHRMHQPVGMVCPLRIAGDFRADDTGGVSIVFGAANAPDLPISQFLDFKRAGRRAVVRAGSSINFGRCNVRHDTGFVFLATLVAL